MQSTGAPTAESATRLTSALAGRYRVERELGQGGMATVFLAVDLKHDRPVALKLLRPELAHAVGAERFLQEIHIAAKLEHPHILTLLDSGDADGLLYYVMPYVEGESLRQRITREGRLSVSDALRLTAQAADALAHAHARGVIHRDIKPENILLSSGHVKVADFGIAKATTAAGDGLTQTGVVMGTPTYMSPEQLLGEPDIDGRTDLYSLACVLYEMLTGAPPLAGGNARAITARRLTEDAPRATVARPEVPPLVDMMLARALAREPSERHATIGDFGAALQSEISGPAAVIAVATSGDHPAMRRTPFVGRDKEMAEARAMLARFVAGSGGILLIGGEPGVGKSRLAEAIMEEARALKALCLIGRCYEMEGTPPYNPFAELLDYSARLVPGRTFRDVLGDSAAEIARIYPSLRQTFPDIPPPLDLPVEQQRQFLFTKYREFNERACRVAPIVVLLDDLHWADESSLLLLEHIATYVAGLPILVLGTYRDVELEVNRPFARTLERLTRSRAAERIALRRLSEDRVGELLAALGGAAPPAALVRVIFQETEGNPFFVEEVFQHLAEEGKLFDAARRWRADLRIEDLDVPEGVRLVIGRRLERLSDACRAVLTSAAVVGPRFRLTILQALGDADGDALLDALEEAERAKLIVEQSAGRETMYSFSHELIRQTLLGTLSLPRRQRRHLKVATAMEQVFGDRAEQHASDLAYHMYQAGLAVEPGKTMRFLLLAGRQALESGAWHEALQHCDRALSIEDPPDQSQVAHVLMARAAALQGLGRWEEALAQFRDAVDAFMRADDAEAAALAARELAMLLTYQARFADAVDVTERARAALPDHPSSVRARLLMTAALVNAIIGDNATSDARLGEAERVIEALKDPDLMVRLGATRTHVHHFRGENEACVAAALQAIPLLQRPDQRQDLLGALGHSQQAMLWCGRLNQAAARHTEIMRLTDEAGHVGAFVMTDCTEAVTAFARSGDIAALSRWGAGIEESWKASGPWGLFGQSYVAACEFLQGDWSAASERMKRMLPSFPRTQWDGYNEGTLLLFDAYRDAADWTQSIERFRELTPPPGETVLCGRRFFVGLLTEALVTRGQFESAAALYPQVEAAARDGLRMHALGLGSCYAALAASAGEDWTTAEAHFEMALAESVSMPHVIAGCDARRWYAWMLLRRRASGDAERARVLIAEAVSGYRKYGMPRHVAVAESVR